MLADPLAYLADYTGLDKTLRLKQIFLCIAFSLCFGQFLSHSVKISITAIAVGPYLDVLSNALRYSIVFSNKLIYYVPYLS